MKGIETRTTYSAVLVNVNLSTAVNTNQFIAKTLWILTDAAVCRRFHLVKEK